MGKTKDSFNSMHSHRPEGDLSKKIFYEDIQHTLNDFDNEKKPLSQFSGNDHMNPYTIKKVEDQGKSRRKFFFDLNDNPDRFLTLKTRRKKNKIRLDKEMLFEEEK